MPSYAAKPQKPVLSLKKAEAPEVVNNDPTVAQSPEPIKLEQDEFVSIAGLASQGREALVAKLRDHMEKSAPKEYVPPALTERQMTRTQMEMEAGRRASERHAAQAAHRPQPKPEASDGYTAPVFRPAGHVPNFDSKDPGAQTLK